MRKRRSRAATPSVISTDTTLLLFVEITMESPTQSEKTSVAGLPSAAFLVTMTGSNEPS